MPATAMNHFTILTDDVDATIAFYGEFLGIAPGDRPPFDFPGAWLYANGQPILHVIGGRPTEELKAGVIDHMAFSARGTRSHDREARGARASVRVPPPARRGNVAALLPRSQRRPRGARFRRARDAMIVTRRTSAASAELDHLIVGADDSRGRHRVRRAPDRRRAGARRQARHHGHAQRAPAPDHRAYLEIIAIDPEGTKPPRPRWFDLDDIALQGELAERPRLVAWVARTPDIDRASAACGMALGAIRSFERGDYRWRLTVPDDGRRPARGIVPTLIQWDVSAHPTDRLPRVERVDRRDRGVPSRIRRRSRTALAALGLSDVDAA